nr:steroid 17-alpha-hydroxylase/17,20 lyase [Quercus suber]
MLATSAHGDRRSTQTARARERLANRLSSWHIRLDGSAHSCSRAGTDFRGSTARRGGNTGMTWRSRTSDVSEDGAPTLNKLLSQHPCPATLRLPPPCFGVGDRDGFRRHALHPDRVFSGLLNCCALGHHHAISRHDREWSCVRHSRSSPICTAFIMSESWTVYGFAVFLAVCVFASSSTSLFRAVDPKAPPLTSDRLPLVGSLRFFTRKWTFFSNALAESSTGHFSFWLGRHHVVGISGESARKLFLENPSLDFVKGAPFQGVGSDLTPPFHKIFTDATYKGRTYFQRRLLDLLKTEQLSKHFPAVCNDAAEGFHSLDRDDMAVVNPFTFCYRIVLAQGCRIVCSDDIPDVPRNFETYLDIMATLQVAESARTVATPWLPSWPHLQRHYCRYRLKQLVTSLLDERLGSHLKNLKDDPLQMLIDCGDSKDDILRFQVSILFIAVANAGVLAGAVLNIIASDQTWQDVICSEITAMAGSYAKPGDRTLIQKLARVPMETWESSLQSIDMILSEAIRMHVSFNMIRQNVGSSSITIPGTDQVIPEGSYVAYNTNNVHYNEALYPNPMTFLPARFKEHAETFKAQQYGCKCR